MSTVMWLCFTAASAQGVVALWLIHEAKTASDGDLDQCHQPPAYDVFARADETGALKVVLTASSEAAAVPGSRSGRIRLTTDRLVQC